MPDGVDRPGLVSLIRSAGGLAATFGLRGRIRRRRSSRLGCRSSARSTAVATTAATATTTAATTAATSVFTDGVDGSLGPLAAGLLLGTRTGGFVIDCPVANIDDALDLALAEFLLERGLG